MDANQKKRVLELRELLGGGAYRVDASAVADALLRRLSGLDLGGEYAEQISSTGQGPRRGRITGTSAATAAHARATALAA